MISSNNFSQNRPTKGSNSFADDKPTKGSNSFAKSPPETVDTIFDGENLSGADYGGDFATFGDIYGDSWYTGRVHFKNRTPNTPSHT